jgi:beta-N-acetylhexosaminidase
MVPRTPAAALAICALVALAACSASRPAAGRASTSHASSTGGAQGPSTGQPVSVVRRLSVAQLAGQRVIYAYAGPVPPPSLLARIRLGQAAGVIFFADNIQSPTQLARVIGTLQAANVASPVHAPLLMLLDQEGGQVRRLPGPPVLSEKQVGRAPHAATIASQTGTDTARSLRAAGINVNLAPVLDVYRSPGDFIDRYDRSYSSRPSIVGTLATAFITAQQQGGVAATAKHFPGLGAAAAGQDTDERPVTIPTAIDRLRATDEAPYRNAIAAGVKLVMTSWATYPALDAHHPAGLSRTVIQSELRNRLGFKGITITDSIGAGALTSIGTVGRRALLAAQAGADLILCSGNPSAGKNTPTTAIDALHGLIDGLNQRTLDKTDAQHAVERIIDLRNSLPGR